MSQHDVSDRKRISFELIFLRKRKLSTCALIRQYLEATWAKIGEVAMIWHDVVLPHERDGGDGMGGGDCWRTVVRQ